MPRWCAPEQVHGRGRFLLRRRDFTPAYLKTYSERRLRDKVEEALAHLGPSCQVCPRLCKGVDPRADQSGVCKVGRHAHVASAFPHLGELKVDEDGLALRGVVVRHLVMPGWLEDTRQIVGWLTGLSRDTYLNLMDQDYPAWKATTNPRFAEINRPVTHPEMTQAQELARFAGLWRLDDRWRVAALPRALLARD